MLRALILLITVACLALNATAEDRLEIANGCGHRLAAVARYANRHEWSPAMIIKPGSVKGFTVDAPGIVDLRFFEYMPDGTVNEYGINGLNVARLAAVGPGEWRWPPAPVDQLGVFRNFRNGRWQHWACDYWGVFSIPISASTGKATLEFPRTAGGIGAGSIDPREPVEP
jgi:hypothetical protein